MGGLRGRLRRLEMAAGGERCPECGLRPGEPITAYELVWETAGEEAPEEPPECPGCGRGLRITVAWEI